MFEKACLLDSPGTVIPFQTGTRNFSSFQTFPDLLWGPPSLLPIGMGLFLTDTEADREPNHSPLFSPVINVC